MAWTDKVSESQLDAWYNMTKWELTTDKVRSAVMWARKNMDRKAMSDELGRVRELYTKHALHEKNCFDSPAWNRFDKK